MSEKKSEYQFKRIEPLFEALYDKLKDAPGVKI